LKAGLIRLIGDPAQHYHEDPVRLLRAVRFAAKLGFRLRSRHGSTAVSGWGHLLEKIPPARLFDEILKLFMGGSAIQTFELLRHYRLFGWLFPATERCLNHQQHHYPKTLLVRAWPTPTPGWRKAAGQSRPSCSPRCCGSRCGNRFANCKRAEEMDERRSCR
jgi:poly(A) polymerase